MKEYRFRCGNYRHFIVTAKNLKQAIKRFNIASARGVTIGFTYKDVTAIEPIQ